MGRFAVLRPIRRCRCLYGLNLASKSEFARQERLASEVRDWDRLQALLYQRLDSGRAPLVLDLFCCAGAVSEGFRRVGGTSYGVDIDAQSHFVARFGSEWFEVGLHWIETV